MRNGGKYGGKRETDKTEAEESGGGGAPSKIRAVTQECVCVDIYVLRVAAPQCRSVHTLGFHRAS
ncbi:MAG: hypothetical protein GY820_42775 [Gammaproteobacteria bacterium]|nr:hypothetical protein [Gammaproteobacteria bacterium]